MKCKKTLMVLTVMSAFAVYQGALTEWASAGEDEARTYVGSESCGECHEDHYSRYTTYSKKASSYDSVSKMRKGLTDSEYKECLTCHTTGYGQPGGFQSTESTPDLKDLGCESCHGPGSAHIESEDPEEIITSLSPKECEKCHNSNRVAAFNFKPLLFGGVH